MLTYEAKIFVKEQMTRRVCINLFEKWMKESLHYSCDDLKLPEDEVLNFSYTNTSHGIQFDVKTYQQQEVELTACMLVNTEGTDVWKVSVVLFKEKSASYVLIQQEYEGKRQLTKHNRPYIITLLSDANLIDSDKYLMLSQKVYQKERLFYQIQEADINNVADLLAGRKQTDLPIVYVSYDCKQHKYSMTSNQINKLARDLIGTAYVLVEPTNPVLIDKISLKSKTCKVFRGYLGIYFPNVDEYIICNPHRKNLLDFVKKEVWTNSISQKSIEGITWKVLINAIDAKDLLKEQENEKKRYSSILHDKKQRLAYYTQFKNIENLVISPSQSLNWLENLALVEKERNFIIDIIQKIGKQRYEKNSRGDDLVEAICAVNQKSFIFEKIESATIKETILDFNNITDSFDELALCGDREINEIKQNIAKTEALLSKFESTLVQHSKHIIVPSNIEEFDEGEINDLIVICLEDELKNATGEAKTKIEKILAMNSQKGIVAKSMDTIKNLVSKSMQITPALISSLEDEGCVFETKGGKSHPKGYYKQSKYTFTLCCTASDYKSPKNTASDMLKNISIY